MSIKRIFKSFFIIVTVLGPTYVWGRGRKKVSKRLPKTIATPSYTIKHRNGVGRSNVYLSNKLFTSIFWTHRKTYAKASKIKTKTTISKNKMKVTILSTYKWSDGFVNETRIYTNDSIKLDYTYIPSKRVQTNKINLHFKFYNVTKKQFSYTKFGKAGGSGTFKDISKNKYKRAICSSISVKNFALKDLDIATDNKCRLVLHEHGKTKPFIRVLVMKIDAYTNPYTNKGKKYHQSLVFDFMPAKGQKDIPQAPLKVTF